MRSPAQITVVIPTYNRVERLRETVQSVLAQTFRDFTLIIADDHSTDGTEAWARTVDDPRVIYYRQPVNLGVGRNWCDGLRRADTELVCLLMDDDSYEPGFLERRVAALAAHPECAFTFSPYTNVDRHGKPEGVSRVFPCADGAVLPCDELVFTTGRGGTHIGTMVFRRRELSNVWSLAERYDLIVDSALVFLLAVIERISGVFVMAPDFRMVRHPTQVFNTRREEVYRRSDELFLDCLARCDEPRLKAVFRTLHAELLDQWAAYLSDRARGRALRLWLRAIRRDPRSLSRWKRKARVLCTIAGLLPPVPVG